jgi:hypothetical protein
MEITVWVYKQSTGQLFDGNSCLAKGYSGSPDAKNDPTKQDVSNHGPIPQGHYTIGAPFDSPTHGPYCLRLTAEIGNVMYGRSGFLMHGDKVGAPGTASQGCIIMPRTVREAVWKSQVHHLQVIE